MCPTDEDIRALIDAGGPTMVFQPIIELSSSKVAGYEALARFPSGTPGDWFEAAAACGLTTELEVSAITAALPALARIAPAYLSVNASAETLVGEALAATLLARLGPRLVVELTEHDAVASYDLLRSRLAMLRASGTGAGVRLGIDDFGAGHATYRHVLELGPDIIKLDVSLVSGIDSDPTRCALVSSLVGFADSCEMTLVAEGIETPEELVTLVGLGVTHAQGYYLSRPGPLP